MFRYSLKVGLVLRRGERHLEVRRLLPGGKVSLEDQETGEPATVTVSQLAQDVLKGRLVVVRTNFASSEPQEGTAPGLFLPLESLPQRHVDHAILKRHLISEMLRAGLSRGMRRQIEKKLSALTASFARKADEKGVAPPALPSASSLMRAWRNLDAFDGAATALVSGHAFRKRTTRVGDVVMDVVRDVIATYYCTRKRPTLSETIVQINRSLPPGTKVSESTVRRTLAADFDRFAVDASRFGKVYAKNKWRYSLKGSTASRALQRVEIDHTVLDLLVTCDRSGMPLGRPTITIVVDSHSGYVLGFFVSFWGTTVSATMGALKQAILPKSDIVQGVGCIEHEWLALGLHECWVVDNGKEFHSRQFNMAALELGCDVLFCPVRQPWFKPHVERALLDLKLALPSEGLVRKALPSELAIDPRTTAAIRFSDLCVCLLKLFVDVTPFVVNTRKLARPYDLFAESMAENPPPELPTNLSALDLLACLNKPEITVGNEGVVHQYLRWNSPELQAMRRGVGHTFRTEIKIQPDNLEFVYVQDPRSKAWLMVPSCCPEYTQGLSLFQHTAIRKRKKDHLTYRNANEVLLRGQAELRDAWASAVKVGRQLKNAQALGKLSCLTSAQVLGQKTAPADAPTTIPLADEEQLVPAKREIPTYETFDMDWR